jgi:hypothetical protein
MMWRTSLRGQGDLNARVFTCDSDSPSVMPEADLTFVAKA